MNRPDRLSSKVILGTFVSTIACILVYCIFLPLSLDYAPAERLGFWKRMMTVGLAVDLLCSWVVYRLYRPVKPILAAISGGASDPLAARGALVALDRIPSFLLWFGPSAYLAAACVNLGIDFARNGTLVPGLALARLALAGAWGFLNGIVTARFLNIILVEPKLALGVVDIEDGGKGLVKTRGKLAISGFALFSFLLVYAGVLFYVRIRGLEILIATGSSAEAFRAASSAAVKSGFGILAGLLVLATALYFVVLSEFQVQLDGLLGQIRRISEGDKDLSRRARVAGFDDVGRMSSAFNRILGSLAETFMGVRDMAGKAYGSSKKARSGSAEARRQASELAELADEAQAAERERVEGIASAQAAFKAAAGSVDSLAQNSADEARRIELAAEGIRGMARSLSESGDRAAAAQAAFASLSESAREGAAGVQRSLSAAREIGEAGRRVGGIAGIIAEVAERSNLLAMNAGIEAAHGGEAGKGFAVVAREMKKLAESVARSASEIGDEAKTVEDINGRAVRAVEGLGSVFTRLEGGIEATGTALAAIAETSLHNAEEAEANLALVEKLKALVTEMLASASGALKAVEAMDAAQERFSGSQARAAELGAALTQGARDIARTVDSLDASIGEALGEISALEEGVSAYKAD